MSYGDKITSNGSLSVLAKLDMRSCHDDGFQYFVKESDFNNLKSYFETLISSEEFQLQVQKTNPISTNEIACWVAYNAWADCGSSQMWLLWANRLQCFTGENKWFWRKSKLRS